MLPFARVNRRAFAEGCGSRRGRGRRGTGLARVRSGRLLARGRRRLRAVDGLAERRRVGAARAGAGRHPRRQSPQHPAVALPGGRVANRALRRHPAQPRRVRSLPARDAHRPRLRAREHAADRARPGLRGHGHRCTRARSRPPPRRRARSRWPRSSSRRRGRGRTSSWTPSRGGTPIAVRTRPGVWCRARCWRRCGPPSRTTPTCASSSSRRPTSASEFGELVLAATESIIADPEMVAASDRWFRHRWMDVQRRRDGLTLDAAGLGPFVTTMAKLLPPASGRDEPSLLARRHPRRPDPDHRALRPDRGARSLRPAAGPAGGAAVAAPAPHGDGTRRRHAADQPAGGDGGPGARAGEGAARGRRARRADRRGGMEAHLRVPGGAADAAAHARARGVRWRRSSSADPPAQRRRFAASWKSSPSRTPRVQITRRR